MGKEVSVILILSIIILGVSLFLYLSPNKTISGNSVTASLALFVEGGISDYQILSPLNTTYNFSIGDNYTLDLNLSYGVVMNSWEYYLYDAQHGGVLESSSVFTPNTSFNAVRWGNTLAVFANYSGNIINKNVSFYVYVPNSAPIISEVNNSIYVCENDYLSYFFNVSDADEDIIELSLILSDPFYVEPLFSYDVGTISVELFSGFLDKNDLGTYLEAIVASDGTYSDYKYTNITVIEVNNAPSVENIGVRTVNTKGENSTFYKIVSSSDTEDGNNTFGNLSFSLDFIDLGYNLFNISSQGVMNFTPSSDDIGVYNISLCVTDTGIINPHSLIETYCEQDGGAIEVCQNFSLTVTDENRPPTIVSYYPLDLIINTSSTSDLAFNISTYDPDGTIPDAYWYADGVLKEYDSGNLIDTFNYNFGCGKSGEHEIEVLVTDGLENDSLVWTVNLEYVECPLPSSSSSGGGGSGGVSFVACEEKWSCNLFSVCQEVENSLKVGLITGDDYREIKSSCEDSIWPDENCGIRHRYCEDFAFCNTSYNQPGEYEACYYIENPSCFDGLKNCHDNSCEVLVDCGGPCSACPTCSDGIVNQGEQGIDCGGPCPWRCEVQLGLIERYADSPKVLMIMFLILVLLFVYLAIKLSRYIKLKKIFSSR